MTYPEPAPWPTGTLPAQALCSETERLAVLASFELEALAGDPELARIARFAARLCNAPSAAISLVEAERQLFLVREGLDLVHTPRSTSLCAHTMLAGGLFEVRDATADPRFAEFDLVKSGPRIRFYAGAPLVSAEGAPLGALCITDFESRPEGLSELDAEGLLVLAEAIKRRIEAHRQARTSVAEIAASAQRLQFMLDSVPDIAWSATAGGRFDYFNARFSKVTGASPPTSIEDWRRVFHPDDYEASLTKFTEALKRCEPFEDEWRMRVADGSYRWVLSRAVPSSTDPATARWFGTLTDIDDAHRLSEDREVLAGELAHRIKNIFSVVTGLINLHARSDPGVQGFAQLLTDNLRALARAQEFALRMDGEAEERLLDLLGVLMAPYGVVGAGAVAITGEDVEVGARAATPLALVFHELATNSAKYGALSAAEGRLAIHVWVEADKVNIAWHESGGPDTAAPRQEGFGSRLVDMSVRHQLGGQIDQQWHVRGLEVLITLPRERLAQ